MERKYILPEIQPVPMQTTPIQPTPMQPTPMQPTPMQTAPMQPTPMQPTPMQPTPMPQTSATQEMVPKPNDNLPIQLVYPEIFYRLQPFVILVCDEFERYNVTPTQEMIDQASNSICAEACRIYPELMHYSYNQAGNDDPPFIREFDLRRRGDFDHDFFMRRFRRRGHFHDLVSILLLSEIFRRL